MPTEDRGWNGTQVLLAFVLGAAAGAATSWFLATPEGRRRREQIGERVREATEGLRSRSGELRESLVRATDAALAAWDEVVRQNDRDS
jgi:gas vesicle protein